MISIEGMYSFEALAKFIVNPSNPVGTSDNLALSYVDSVTDQTLKIIPLNPHHSSKHVTTLDFISITFLLQDQDYENRAKYVLFRLTAQTYCLIAIEQAPNIQGETHICVAQSLVNYLNIEFNVAEIKLFSDFCHNFQVDSLPNLELEKVLLRINSLEEIKIFPNQSAVSEMILTAGPSISPLEKSYVNDAVTNGWNSHHADYLTRFENEFAKYVGAKYAMATSSCTGALHLSLLALGIGEGDEVLVPDITWVATASAIRYVGAKPIFVDIDKLSWSIDISEVKKLITPSTKAIIPVHLYGYGAPMPEIMNIAADHNLFVVEDAAPAIGTRIGSQFAGTFGDFGCYSFQGAKLLVTGEGGMLVTNNSDLFAKAKKIQDHGRKPGTFWIEELGHKYKMNNITAALGLGQIQRAENQILRKRRINEWYREALSELPGVSFQLEAPNTQSICWMSSFTIDPNRGVSRDQLISELKKRGIDSRPVFPSISQYEIWGYDAEVPRNSKYIGDNGINLPSGVLLNQNSIEKVILSIKDILK